MTPADEVVSRFAASVDREALSAHGVHVLVGDDEASHRWRSDDRENVYSVAKGVCALAAGIAIHEGVVRLDTTVAESLPSVDLGDGVDAITLHDLLAMRSGIDFRWFGSQPVPWPDLTAEMLRRPTRGPGSVFQYSEASTYVAMRMLGATVGDVLDWLRPRLFDPLGIRDPRWHRCPLGRIIAGSGLELRSEELARIGRLLRDRGRWRDAQLVLDGWIVGMHAKFLDTGAGRRTNAMGLRPGPAQTAAGGSMAHTAST